VVDGEQYSRCEALPLSQAATQAAAVAAAEETWSVTAEPRAARHPAVRPHRRPTSSLSSWRTGCAADHRRDRRRRGWRGLQSFRRSFDCIPRHLPHTKRTRAAGRLVGTLTVDRYQAPLHSPLKTTRQISIIIIIII